MTYPAEVREQAISRVQGGESIRSTARALDIPESNIRRWLEGLPEAITAQIGAPVREQLGNHYMTAAARNLAKLDEISQMANDPLYIRDLAYAGKVMIESAAVLLGWKRDEDRGGNTYIDARTQNLYRELPEGVTWDDMRRAAQG